MRDRRDNEAVPARPAPVFFGVGACCVVAGGLVAAVTDPLGLAKGSWLAAYLVLVAGVAQCAVGWAQERLAMTPVPAARWWTQLVCWNVGNALVIAGTLLAVPGVVDAGGLGLLGTLALALHAVRRAHGGLVLWGYRALLTVVAVSVPVGLVLARLRVG